MSNKSQDDHNEPVSTPVVKNTVLPAGMGGGPHGVGDPNDQTLRHLERDVIIPKKMRRKAHVLCRDVVKVFNNCGKESGLLTPLKCRQQIADMNACLASWYSSDEFREKCTEEYLADRTRFRETGEGVYVEDKRKKINIEDLKEDIKSMKDIRR